MKRHARALIIAAALWTSTSAQQWPQPAGDQAASHYSPLDQITPVNVGKLRIAWEWSPNERNLPQFGTRPGAFQSTPIVIDNVMYVSTMYYGVAALDPTTGREWWRYDSKAYEDGQPPNGTGYVHRGIAAWRDSSSGALRIVLNARYKLIELDAKTGTPVASFGKNGIVDLSEGLVWAINNRARCEDRHARRLLRQQRHRRSQRGTRLGDQQEALHQYLAAGRLQGSDHPRQRRWGPLDVQERSAGRCARVQRAHRQAGVDLPHHSAAR
jgi:hypothetical protein